MDAVLMMLGLALAALLYGTSKLFDVPRLLADWRSFQAWRAAQAAISTSQPQTQPVTMPALESKPLAGACYALARPPAHLQQTLTWLAHHDADDRYAFPIGWYRSTHDQASLCRGSFVGDTNHMLLTGMSDAGKDNLALNILLTLALRNAPTHLQVSVIDGKGLDFIGWQGKAHTWRLALKPEEIRPAMDALSAERERRRELLASAGVSKWETYDGRDLPLLIVYVSELSLLEDATGARELGQWLNSELAAGRAFGIRYIIATQTASNYATRWRSQIGLYLAGFQPSDSQDAPNTGLTTRELESHQALPPSKLPPPPIGAGVFTAVHGREAITVRASYLHDAQRCAWLQRLPAAASSMEAPGVAEARCPSVSSAFQSPGSALPGATGAETDHPALSVVAPPMARETLPAEAAVLAIPEEEKRQILDLAAAGHSRRRVCEHVYGAAGGRAYERVKAVLDQQVAQTA